MRSTILVIALLSASASASPPQTVRVMYAGSLVTPMEGPVAQALAARGVTFDGEGRGSREIANFILGGLRKPDVVIVVDSAILARLQGAGLIAQSWQLGTASLGVAGFHCDPRCPSLVTLLHTSGMRIARTDPRLDPKGRYTIEAMRLLLGADGERRLLGSDENPAQTFPEESLLVRLETHEADFGFVYSTEARARHLDFIQLPGRASMSDKIRYFVAIMKNAPHSSAAHIFVDFILHGRGRSILESAGLVTRSAP